MTAHAVILRVYKQAAQGSRAQTDEIDLVGHRDCLGESVNAAMRRLDDLKIKGCINELGMARPNEWMRLTVWLSKSRVVDSNAA